MNEYELIEQLIDSKIIATHSLTGGCIADTRLVTFANQQQVVVKLNNPFAASEAHGLIELSKAQVIRVPRVIYYSANLLVVEFIPSAAMKRDFWQDFGVKLAQLHGHSSPYFGFYEDNYIGSNRQLNDIKQTTTTWRDFYWQYRLLAPYQLAEQCGLLSRELAKKFARLEQIYHKIIIDDGQLPALLHGDLWSGNYLLDSVGNPVLIDPAVYYGHPEAELAMTKLFGGFPREFYSAYQAQQPLTEDYFYREKIYQLYHLLNHLNLFGGGYLAQVSQAIDFYIQ